MYGDLILEKYCWAGAVGTCQAPEGILGGSDEVRLGGAASVAALAASLGARTTVAGAVGDNSCGRTLLRLFDEAGVDRSLVSVSRDYSTPVIERTIRGSEHDGSARISSTIRSRRQRLSPSLQGQLLNAVLPEISQYDLLLILDDGGGACSRDLLAGLITPAKAENVLVCVDPRRTRDYSRYAGASLIKTSRARAEFMTRQEIITDQDALEAGREICRRWDLLMTVITLGREGMALVEAVGDQLIVPTTPQEIFEKSGAREAALAVIGICLGQGTCGPDALRLANLAAGLEIQRFGIKPISHRELHQAAVTQGESGSRRKPRRGRSRASRDAEKVVRKRKLLEAIACHREQGRRIVLVVGRFETLGQRLLGILEAATSIGDVVIAGVRVPDAPDEDESAGAENRARMLATSPWVDYVVKTPNRKLRFLLDQVRPEVVMMPEDCPEPQITRFVERYGGEVQTGSSP